MLDMLNMIEEQPEFKVVFGEGVGNADDGQV